MGGKVELVSVLRRRLASACAEDPGIASWGDRDRWRMTMMIVSISVCSGHIQLSTTTVYLEGSRFDIWPSLIWREPVVTAPVHGRLWKKFIAQLVEIRQIWFINLRRNIIHETSCWRDARMRPNIASSIYIYVQSRAMGKVRLRHSCMKRLWCLFRGWNRSIGVWRKSRGLKNFLKTELRYLDNCLQLWFIKLFERNNWINFYFVSFKGSCGETLVPKFFFL